MDSLYKKVVLHLFFCTVLVAQLKTEQDVLQGDIVSFLTREKCYEELGCFSAKSPFFDIVERPLSLLPDDRELINVHFLMYTREDSLEPFKFSNVDDSLDSLMSRGFDPQVNTKFVIPGFMSGTAPYWQMPLKEALLSYEPCNIFFVDWHQGDGPLYEQAVANTRVVGAEIAFFIKKLQSKTAIKLDTVHLIGHSLGAHIAGYAGKRLSKVGRITAMDPAGPYFINVDEEVRLDREDAIFVDAIHTNAAPNRFEGFGLAESIGHFDFYPNGGHLQPGCEDMGHNVWEFLKHPSFDPEGLRDLQCNHARAIYLFTSSLMHGQCEVLGTQCDSWEDFANGRCGNCTNSNNSGCVPLGIHAEDFKEKYGYKNALKSVNFYMRTTDRQPYCNGK